ncbi:MAG TPA: hypothetical protein VHU80_25235, partial [Polyangiaceae bacterium]|nr:hypothetical protein [Polyangiaceae bacterium]
MPIGAFALVLAQSAAAPAPATEDVPAPASDDVGPAPVADAERTDATAPSRRAAEPWVPPRAVPAHVGTSFKGSVGAYYQRLFDASIFGGGLSFAIGSFKRDRTLYLQLDLEHGNTTRGLSTWGGRLLFAPEWSLGRLRLGLAVGAGYLQLGRVTRQTEMTSFTLLCSELHASFDIVDVSD